MLRQLPPVTKGYRSVQGIAHRITPLPESFPSADSASHPLESIWVTEKALCSQRVISHFGNGKAGIAMLTFKSGEKTIRIFYIFFLNSEKFPRVWRSTKANESGI